MQFSRKILGSFLTSVFLLGSLQTSPAFAATGKSAMVATAEAAATEAAVNVLREGGNAVDAAVAAQWVLNVVEPHSSGIGGGGFFVYYEAKTGKVYTFDGREKAPARAVPPMFLDEKGEPFNFWPERITGGLSVGVPGTLKLLSTVHQKFSSGKFTFGQLFEPAIQLAEKGFPVSPRLASFIQGEKDRLAMFPASREIFLDSDGNGKRPGEILRQPDLARTFRLIAEKGIGVFYEGEIAQDIVKAVGSAPFHPGLMTLEDVKSYQVAERPPVSAEYRGYEIYGAGPPSSGGTTVLETLNILKNYDFAGLDRAEQVSLLGQAQFLSFKDRDEFLADPDFVDVPVERLLSDGYAESYARSIDLHQPDAVMKTRDQLEPAPAAAESTHTTHLSIVDPEGNIVAFTTTIEHMFGSALTVPGRGIVLNNELTDFAPYPEYANEPGPNKRPRSSMSPTIVFKDKKPVLVAGSPGGSKIIGIVINLLVNVLDLGMPLDKAMAEPRILDRDGPLEVEADFMKQEELVTTLKAWGFQVTSMDPMGNAQAILIRDGQLIGESDPRGDGLAKGF